MKFDTFGTQTAYEEKLYNEDARLFKVQNIHKYITKRHYAIFRISNKKYKSLAQLKHYENHMERKGKVLNGDSSIQNERLIGTVDIVGDVQRYIKGIKLRSNAVLARDLLLTASPDFFKRITEEDKRKWVDLNINWLKDNFGDNVIYAILHKDESTWHISALIVPKIWDSKRNRYKLSNAYYFDGIEKLRAWQDNYSSSMQKVFKSLNRGVRYSKAKHITMKQFYTLVNSKLNEKDIKQLCAKAKHSHVLQQKLLQMQNTLNAYENIGDKALQLNKQLKGLQQDKKMFKECIRVMADLYKIPQVSVKKVLKYVQEKAHQQEQEQVRERCK